MKVYLCGGINALSDAAAMGWRAAATRQLRHETIDPMRRDYRGKESENVAAIIGEDLDDIAQCDALLVNAFSPSWGTAMEVALAKRVMNKYVVVWHPPEKPVSPWLRGHSDVICASLKESTE